MGYRWQLWIGMTAAALALGTGNAAAGEFVVRPTSVTLAGNEARAQLLVTAVDTPEGPSALAADLTGIAVYSVSPPGVVQVSASGELLAVADGEAVVTVQHEGVVREVPVAVSGVVPQPAVSFTTQVLPILYKAGCNMGACHASQHGKGGFVLSVMGYDPPADREMIVRDRQGRRVNFLEPEQSLLLLKPTMQVPHGGGKRLAPGSPDFKLLSEWIARGAPGPQRDGPRCVKIDVLPKHRVAGLQEKQQLQVTAAYSDGTVRDVTAWAKYDSMDEGIVVVQSTGRYSTVGRGQAPVMVRFDGQAEISMVVVPYEGGADLAGWQDQNFVDTHAAAKFRELSLTPSERCDDATFLRRAWFDAIGTLPPVEEVRSFLASTDPAKRTKMIDRLLGFDGSVEFNDAYAAYWTIKWSDLIRNNSNDLGPQGMWAFHNWLRGSFRENKPFDRFTRELITARGSIFSNGPANYYRIATNAPDLAETTAQLFLGVRLQCAKCHHHPFEKYGQDDYYGFAAFFSRVGTKNSSEFGLFGGESVVLVRSTGEVAHPKTGRRMAPTPLEGQPIDEAADRRVPLAEWLTSPQNRMFARNVVNRYCSYLLGRGLVEPVDDMRATNPPSNVPLMEALADDFIASGYNLKHLMRTIMTSRLYQLSSQPTPANASDRRFYSHYLVKRITAEPLLDAVDRACGTATKFRDLPLGTRAIELPDAEYPDYFLNVFAKPKRVSVCECERSPDENLAQALHTLNGDVVAGKIGSGTGRIAKLLESKAEPDVVVTELFLATVSRPPTERELETARRFLAESPSPKEFYEDVLWSLINSKEFLYVH